MQTLHNEILLSPSVVWCCLVLWFAWPIESFRVNSRLSSYPYQDYFGVTVVTLWQKERTPLRHHCGSRNLATLGASFHLNIFCSQKLRFGNPSPIDVQLNNRKCWETYLCKDAWFNVCDIFKNAESMLMQCVANHYHSEKWSLPKTWISWALPATSMLGLLSRGA